MLNNEYKKGKETSDIIIFSPFSTYRVTLINEVPSNCHKAKDSH
jgi:hypothetical protein